MPAFTALLRRAPLAVAVVLTTCVALVGALARPNPPSLSMNVTGDRALAALVLAHLDGALDRVSIATIDIAALPIAIWELSLGLWLVVRGFTPSSASATSGVLPVATTAGLARP